MSEQLAREYPEALRRKKQLEALLEEFETGKNRSIAMKQKLETNTRALDQQIAVLNAAFVASGQSVPKATRGLWQRRLEGLQQANSVFKSTIARQLQHVLQIQGEANERHRLMTLGARRRDVSSAVEQFGDERQKLHEVGSILDAVTQQGSSVVSNLVRQNITLKGARKKLLDLWGTLGVSAALVGAAERRHKADRLLVYACMVLCVAVFVCLYYAVKIRVSDA